VALQERSQIGSVLSNRISTKWGPIVSKRLFWDAGSFGPISQIDQVAHDPKRFIADGVGFRTFFFAVIVLVRRFKHTLFLLTIEGDRAQLWRTEIVKGKLKGLDVQRRTA
jgi:hypothetical protein